MNANVSKLLNEQINKEFYSAYLYLDFANYYAFLEMKREHPSIAIGTVYKHLNALAGEGLLHRITESGSPDRYDRTERHDHLICSRCGKIADVHLPDMQSRIEHTLGREILSYDLKIRYICPDCREQEKDNLMEEKYHER